MKNSFSLVIVFSAFLFFHLKACNPDSIFIRVHFLHGSKPKKQFKYEEDRWFGGLLGGHAGIEYEKNKILNFVPKAKFHFFSKRSIINSRFAVHDTISFYALLGGKPDSVKKTIITIAISARQKTTLDSLAEVYQNKCPYDYAFFGMRCGAAAYDVLAQAGIVRKYTFGKTWRKIFYPRKLRRRLEKQAAAKNYVIKKQQGSKRRTWEKD